MKGAPLFILMIFSLLLAGVAPALNASYDLMRWTVSSSSSSGSAGGGYSLIGTSGQPGVGELAGSDIGLGSGFWGQLPGEARQVYLSYIAYAGPTTDHSFSSAGDGAAQIDGALETEPTVTHRVHLPIVVHPY